MSRWLLSESRTQIIVKILRHGQSDKIFLYRSNLGTVRKETYEGIKNESFNYIAKNHEQLIRENKERLKKMKKEEVC